MLRYPDGGFLVLMALGLSAEGWIMGTFVGPLFTDTFGTFGTAGSLIFTVIFGVLGIAGSYYFAKGAAWLLSRLYRPQL